MTDFGASSNSLPLTLVWARESRDSALVPSRGRLQRLNCVMILSGVGRYQLEGEPVQEMHRIVREVGPLLPEDRPHYLMGIGSLLQHRRRRVTGVLALGLAVTLLLAQVSLVSWMRQQWQHAHPVAGSVQP